MDHRHEVSFLLTNDEHEGLVAECVAQGKTEDEYVYDLVVHNIPKELPR